MIQPHGSSLFQTRDAHWYSHAHSHAHSLFHQIRHNAPHWLAVNRDSSPDDDRPNRENTLESVKDLAGSSHGADFKRESTSIADAVINDANDQDSSYVTHIIQTVSIIQYVDQHGSAYQQETIYAPPKTAIVDPVSGNTISIQGAFEANSISLAGFVSGEGETVASSSETVYSSSSTTSSLSTASTTGTLPTFPSVGAIHNSTNSLLPSNSTVLLPSNSSSIYRLLSASVTLPVSSESSSKTDQTSYTTYSPTSTANAGNQYPTVVDTGKPTSDPSPGASNGTNLTPQQKQVIGGVVGAVAGISALVFMLMLLMRYKKRRGVRAETTSDRSLAGGLSGNGSGSVMAERSSAATAIAAAFASLTGKRQVPDPKPAESGEQGFYRVAGRKLPPVLISGGDGYSDPRGSATSGSSDYYRGSQAFEPSADGLQLALGSPMRPVSGVPIMRSGPARIPITENPFSDPQPPRTPTNASSGSLALRESPIASGSRFQERI